MSSVITGPPICQSPFIREITQKRRDSTRKLTSSAARRHFSTAISCVVPWISGTSAMFSNWPTGGPSRVRVTIENTRLDVDSFTLCTLRKDHANFVEFSSVPSYEHYEPKSRMFHHGRFHQCRGVQITKSLRCHRGKFRQIRVKEARRKGKPKLAALGPFGSLLIGEVAKPRYCLMWHRRDPEQFKQTADSA